jgi:membrane-associated protease RseP (regulator of RpoE activity)
MKTKSLVCAAVAFLLPLCIAWSDEPQQAQSRPENQSPEEKTAIDPVVSNYFTDLSHFFAVLDVNDSLVSANGLGIDVATPDAALMAQLGLSPRQGMIVTSVPEESQGAKAGLKVHDIITQVNEAQISHLDALKMALHDPEGGNVKLHIVRGGKPLVLEATVAKPQVAKLFLENALVRDGASLAIALQETYRLGVTLSEADDTLRAHLRLAAGEGLVVTDVVAESAAAAAGVKQHDVLIVLDGKRLTTVEAINAQVQEIKERLVDLRLLRGGEEMVLQVTPRKIQQQTIVDQPITIWDTKVCQRCHDNPHAGQDNALRYWDKAHAHAALRLGANNSVWTDGVTAKVYGRWIDGAQPQQAAAAIDAAITQAVEGAPPTGAAAPQEQIAALKAQLAAMQKTLDDLEAALAKPQPPAEEEKK